MDPTTMKVPRETITSAISALTAWKAKATVTQKAQLLPSDEFIYLVITLNKIPQKPRTSPYKLPLPHPIHTPTDSHLCLIIDDTRVPSKVAKQKLLDDNIPVEKVIKLSKLRTDYKAFESKRKLCDSYDMFFADKRVVTCLPRLLGKEFFRRKKVPVPVELGRGNWREQVARACSAGMLFVSTGSCCVVRVARASMRSEEIVENVERAIEGAVEVLPRKWDGVRSLCVKFADSLALPVYQSVPQFRMKIGSGVVAVEEEVKESEKKGGKKAAKKKGEKVAKKKGRIHEVMYMDSVGGEEEKGVGGDEDESGSEGGGIGGKKRKKMVVEEEAVSEGDEEERSEIEEMGSDESAGKKRKKGSTEKKGVKKVKKEKVKEGVKKGLKQKKVKKSPVKKAKRSRVIA